MVKCTRNNSLIHHNNLNIRTELLLNRITAEIKVNITLVPRQSAGGRMNHIIILKEQQGFLFLDHFLLLGLSDSPIIHLLLFRDTDIKLKDMDIRSMVNPLLHMRILKPIMNMDQRGQTDHTPHMRPNKTHIILLLLLFLLNRVTVIQNKVMEDIQIKHMVNRNIHMEDTINPQ